MRLRILILLVMIGFSPIKSFAVTCTISSTPNVSFSAVSPLTYGDILAEVPFSFTCTKSAGDLLNATTLCFNIYATGSSTITSRKMTATTGNAVGSGTLNYQLYRDAARTIPWGNQDASGSSFPVFRTTALNLGPYTNNLTIYAKIPKGQNTTPPGIYKDIYSTITASITANMDLLLPISNCGTTSAGSFAFEVSATVNKQCNVSTAANVDFGSVPSTQTNMVKNTSFTTTCTSGTPYTLGLSPSNNSSTGAGAMKSQKVPITNTEQVPYQLNSTPGINGTPWGTLNGYTLADTGNGSSKPSTVYIVTPSANYPPDTYADTVTINVTY
ncbi:TPA: spore coat protein U domain-containing protein [Kluyvera cryocrescens]